MVTDTDSWVAGIGETFVVIVPSTLAGTVAPSPVPYRTMVDPRAAGLDAMLTERSELSADAWPLPLESAVNNPGYAGITLIFTAAEFWLLKFTTTEVWVLTL